MQLIQIDNVIKGLLCLWRWHQAMLGDWFANNASGSHFRCETLELSHSKHVFNRIGSKEYEFGFL